MKQLIHKFWRSDTTLHDADGNIIDQRNRWDIMSDVKYPAKYKEDEGQYHTFTVTYFFIFEHEFDDWVYEPIFVDADTYWKYRIGDWIE